MPVVVGSGLCRIAGDAARLFAKSYTK